MILNSIISLLSGIISVPEEEIEASIPLTAEYGIQGIDIAKLVIEIEKCFKITIYDEDVHTFQILSDVEKYVQALIEE